jgi:hypothetical protein
MMMEWDEIIYIVYGAIHALASMHVSCNMPGSPSINACQLQHVSCNMHVSLHPVLIACMCSPPPQSIEYIRKLLSGIYAAELLTL